MSSDHSIGLDAAPPYQPNGRSDEQGVPSNAVKQDKGARVFAVIAILLFVCYFIGALTASAGEERGRQTRHGAAGSRFVMPLLASAPPSRMNTLRIVFKGIVAPWSMSRDAQGFGLKAAQGLSVCPSRPISHICDCRAAANFWQGQLEIRWS
jgi:hypothetical protein